MRDKGQGFKTSVLNLVRKKLPTTSQSNPSRLSRSTGASVR